MKVSFALFAGALAAAVLVGGPDAQAADIATLFNTGVDATGATLADGTIGDPHYSLVSVPAGTTDLRVRTSVGGFPIPPYFGDDTSSTWIGPNNDASLDAAGGLFDFQTTFSLAGFNPATASITGGWSSDNNGVQILLNGVDTGNAGTDFAQFSLGFAPFSITSGFQSGLNTIDFIVSNGWESPAALRVEMTGAADLARGVPEPASWALMIGGFGLAGAALRRRRTVVAG